ncbi:hypothetical protein ACIA8E_30570 [Streptomyces sp. NPDC051664]|uniref:hypothetical protein n=1 Tax=Streptomyces sp. NPDC051664 TaxID=3365668 RepID=UPI00379D785C
MRCSKRAALGERQGLEQPPRTRPGPPLGRELVAAALQPESAEHADGDVFHR